MKSFDEYMALYFELFQEPSSKLILKPSVLIAFFAIIAILWSISFFLFLAVALGLIIYYYSLSHKLALAGALLIGISLALQLMIGFLPIILFVLLALAIAGQLYGHNLEGEKLSFLENVMFQIIGPLWAIGPRNLRKFDLY